MEDISFLLPPFIYFVLAIPLGFVLAAFVQGMVGIPRWIVEHAGA